MSLARKTGSPTQARLATGDEAGSLATGRRVLMTEAAAVTALAASLDGAFERAVDLLFAHRGRIVVTGMGKSGHVARKIAATLASTGSPALYVHPAEASHGDLGMLTTDDALIALSNSGDTPELGDILNHCKRFNIPFVGITSGAPSALADLADVALLLPAAEEACPMGLAPTSSTTMMLALGDALAVALIERRGFSAEDFRNLHPGGRLGRKLLRVGDLMHAGDELPVTAATTRMDEAILVITAKRFGCVGIVDDKGALLGIITDGDLRRHMAPDLLKKPVAAIMTGAPHTIRPDALAAEALRLMNENAITSLFVTADGRPVGILHIHDCLRAGVA
ncbi:MAG: KpsF/GutQ family sugar-phosphate isomerase [Rhodospirillaceae bacterium]|nr:KpsF/GutQ family sugar-phosphate isomerase [Rhodospirillaceae bacterium]